MAWGIVKRFANAFTRRARTVRRRARETRHLELRAGGENLRYGDWRHSILWGDQLFDCDVDETSAQQEWARKTRRMLHRLARIAERDLINRCPRRTGRLVASIGTLHISRVFTRTGARAYYAPFVRRYHDALIYAFDSVWEKMESSNISVTMYMSCGAAYFEQRARLPVRDLFEVRVENLHHVWIELLEPELGYDSPVRDLPPPYASIGAGDAIGFQGPAYTDASGRRRWGRENWDVVYDYEGQYDEGLRIDEGSLRVFLNGWADGGDDFALDDSSYEGTDGPYDDGGGGGDDGGGDSSSDDERVASR